MSFSHICIGRCENIYFLSAKNVPSQDNKFLLYTVEAIETFKKSEKNYFEKMYKYIQPMSFYFINVETIGKYKNVKKKFTYEKIYMSSK